MGTLSTLSVYSRFHTGSAATEIIRSPIFSLGLHELKREVQTGQRFLRLVSTGRQCMPTSTHDPPLLYESTLNRSINHAFLEWFK